MPDTELGGLLYNGLVDLDQANRAAEYLAWLRRHPWLPTAAGWSGTTLPVFTGTPTVTSCTLATTTGYVNNQLLTSSASTNAFSTAITTQASVTAAPVTNTLDRESSRHEEPVMPRNIPVIPPTLFYLRQAIRLRDIASCCALAEGLTQSQNHEVDRVLGFFSSRGINLIWCEWDGCFADATNSFETDNGAVSMRAYERDGFTCTVCDEIHQNHARNAFRDESADGVWICDDCTNGYEWSDRTHSYWPEGERPEDNDDDDDAPDDDTPDEDDDLQPVRYGRRTTEHATTILSYSSDVLRHIAGFLHTETELLPLNPLWLGVELEVYRRAEGSVYYVSLTKAAVDAFAILKSDSSIPESGFEIVTVPATLAKHYQLWQPFFDGPAKHLASWPGGKCGMHVHYDRKAIRPITLARMMFFITRRDNRPFIEKVAGRGHSDYNILYDKRLNRELLNVLSGDLCEQQRHEALNTRPNTVELRIFRGNVSQGGFFKNLEFAHALWAFCDQAAMGHCTFKAFLDWFAQSQIRKDYGYLNQWAIKHALIAGPRLRLVSPLAPVRPVIDFTESAA